MPNYRTIEIDLDIHKLIESERRNFTELPNIVLRRLLRLPTIEAVVQPVGSHSSGRSWSGDGVTLPHGSALRMEYNGRQYEGRIDDGKWAVEGKVFDSPSGAASGIATTKSGNRTRLDGWIYWEVRMPGDAVWTKIRDLRRTSHHNDEREDELLAGLPLERTWLDRIVDILLHRPNGTAEVKAIAIEMMRLDHEVGTEPESTITRTINNYCSDANDSDRRAKFDLFARVAPGTYRLRTYPNRPDLTEIQYIFFADAAYKKTWADFLNKTKSDKRFSTLNKRQLLVAFAERVRSNGSLYPLLQAYQSAFSIFDDRSPDSTLPG